MLQSQSAKNFHFVRRRQRERLKSSRTAQLWRHLTEPQYSLLWCCHHGIVCIRWSVVFIN